MQACTAHWAHYSISPLRLFADILDDALRETEGAKQPIPAPDAAFLTAERTESKGGGSRKEEGRE